MKNLINIKINEKGKQIVGAKELYLGLGLNEKNWSRWYPTNIQKNVFFQENIDWVGFLHNDENQKGGRPTQDFAITLEFAKHIAMMAKTDKSHQYRNYFIKCEKQLKSGQEQKVIEGLNSMIEGLKKTIEENKETIEEYKSMCRINCSKKHDYTSYIKKRLGILKSNSEFEQVKARVFFILNINKWEDIDLETSKNILNIIDESITVIKRERPYKQMSYFE